MGATSEMHLQMRADEIVQMYDSDFSKKIGIYKITSPTGKIYIGQSIDIKRRFLDYKGLKCINQRRLYNSFIKYGIDNHFFEIVKECSTDKLNFFERQIQEEYKCIDKNGLNCSYTKTNDLSGKMSECSKIKMSISQTGKKLTEETKSKMSVSKKGVKKPLRSENHKLNISKSKIGNDYMLGKKHSISSKNKMSNSLIGRKFTNEHLTKLRKRIINTVTGDVFYGVKSLAEFLNVKEVTLCHQLNGTRTNKTIYQYE